MKKLLLTIVTFSVLFVIGCQENSITDSLQDVSHQELQKTEDPLVHYGTITLDGMLADPHPVMNSFYIITGEIIYEHRLEILDPIPPNPQFLVSLNLSVSSVITYLCTVCEEQPIELIGGSISSVTNDTFYLSEPGAYLLEKSFPINGMEDRMVLVCRFLVTTESVIISEMFLELQEDETQS